MSQEAAELKAYADEQAASLGDAGTKELKAEDYTDDNEAQKLEGGETVSFSFL